MEEKLIETLRGLVTEHDVELAEMLQNSDKMAEERDRLFNSLLQNNNHSQILHREGNIFGVLQN